MAQTSETASRVADLVPGQYANFVVPEPGDLNRIAPVPVREAYCDVCRRRISEFQAIISVASTYQSAEWKRSDLASALSLATELMLHQHDENAVLLSRLLLQAVESSGADKTSWAYRSARSTYLQCGKAMLFTMPAGPLFAGLSDLAAAQLEAARATGDPEAIARALYDMAGVRKFFHLERRNLAWWSDEQNWINLLAAHVDRSVLTGPLRDQLRPPDALKEMQAAESILLELLELQTGPERARTQVDLVWNSVALGDESSLSRETLVCHLREAVAVQGHHRTGALQLLDDFRALETADRDIPIHDGSLAADLDRLGPTGAVQTFRTDAWLAMRLGRYDEAARLTREYLSRDVAGAPDQERMQALDVAVHCGDHGLVACHDVKDVNVQEVRRALTTSAQPGQLGYGLLHAALHAPTLAAADEILAEPDVAHPTWRGPLATLRKYVRARVAYEEVRRRYLRPGFEISRLRLLVEALRLYAELGYADAVRTVLGSLAKAVHHRPDTAQSAVDLLAARLDRVLASVDDVGDAVALLGAAVAFPVRYPLDDPTGICFVHSQLFKGLQVAAVVRNPGPLTEDADDAVLDEEIARLEAEHAANPDDAETVFTGENVDSELLTLLYAGDSQLQSGGTVEERRHNLRATGDRAVRRRLYRERLALDILRGSIAKLEGGPHRRGRLMSISELNSYLDSRTVLVDVYTGPRDDSAFCCYLAIYGRDGWSVEASQNADDFHTLVLLDPRHPGRLLKGHNDAVALAELRRRLVDSPGPRRPVSRDVAERLSVSPLSALTPALSEYAAKGYDRLCLWPHATSHYAPLHLMHLKGRPLADDWLITTIPTVACIIPKGERITGTPAPPTREITVLAASSPEGGLDAGYPAVPELKVQAATIAASHGGSLLLEPRAATPQALLDHMPRSRYVHLAAHGSADPFAPAFQALHFTGRAGSGALTARMLMHADLRAVDLVTLSACESALGRFDQLDNQAGIVAALLGAGVTAVVACLWPVRPEPSSFFFTSLYQSLALQGPKADLRGAFRSAQLTTRSEYPAYRDWGAFVYSGGW